MPKDALYWPVDALMSSDAPALACNSPLEAIGGWARWGLSVWLNPRHANFYWGTFAANAIGGLLVGLYATLYVLLNLEAYSLIIGSLLLFVALAVVMWATRAIDWGARRETAEVATASAA